MSAELDESDIGVDVDVERVLVINTIDGSRPSGSSDDADQFSTKSGLNGLPEFRKSVRQFNLDIGIPPGLILEVSHHSRIQRRRRRLVVRLHDRITIPAPGHEGGPAEVDVIAPRPSAELRRLVPVLQPVNFHHRVIRRQALERGRARLAGRNEHPFLPVDALHDQTLLPEHIQPPRGPLAPRRLQFQARLVRHPHRLDASPVRQRRRLAAQDRRELLRRRQPRRGRLQAQRLPRFLRLALAQHPPQQHFAVIGHGAHDARTAADTVPDRQDHAGQHHLPLFPGLGQGRQHLIP